jgi:hypothetical protein
MNTTATQLPASPSENADRPRKSHGRRRRLALLIASTGAALAVSLAGVGAASADTVPGYGTGSTNITCGFGVYMQIQMTPDNRYWEDHFYVQNVSTGVGSWSAWYVSSPGNLDTRYLNLPSGAYRFYMQYAVWNGSSWVGSYGEWITQYLYVTGGTPRQYSYCYV